jgi:hypothetical protein
MWMVMDCFYDPDDRHFNRRCLSMLPNLQKQDQQDNHNANGVCRVAKDLSRPMFQGG